MLQRSTLCKKATLEPMKVASSTSRKSIIRTATDAAEPCPPPCRLGVCIDNWQEEAALQQTFLETGSIRGAPGKFDGTTLQKATYTAEGKYGPGIVPSRIDKEPIHNGLHADQLFSHSRDPREASLVSLSQLTLGRPSVGDPRVSQLLWTGSKHVDSRVPNGPPTGTTAPRSAAYQEKLRKEATYDMYTSTAREATEATANLATDGACKRQLALPQSEGGQRPQIGRKASGEFVKSLEAPHRTVGLRT
ncbi:hypothetical protein KFL_001000260 [Klebsormidium nitens]|uniref:Flagellar associated protein n=1 Tax=Klebsormidium nitens TaxID=105231 RepID=A0A1Y1HTZ9_KLENI|nr:hypothetical protein KFL_001000260 [Klebsormidium nitens]|eukprot:GAQ82104.1 hypothetical protein KFL_001000260 [Klebsormidium nitens]